MSVRDLWSTTKALALGVAIAVAAWLLWNVTVSGAQLRGWGTYQLCGNPYCAMCYGRTPMYRGSWRPDPEPSKPERPADWAPTPDEAIQMGLDAAQVGLGDVVSDLGCGDGRWLVAAAQRGATAYGYEIDEWLCQEAQRRWANAGRPGQVAISQTDLFRADLSDTTVVVLYQSSDLLSRLRPRLEQLPPGRRIVSYSHALPGVATQRLFVCDVGPIWLYETPLSLR